MPFAIATPYRTIARPKGDAVLVVVTEATLPPDRRVRAAFWRGVALSEADLVGRPGALGYAKRRELFGPRAWTLTVWDDVDGMRRFVGGEAHRAAIRAARADLLGERFARFETPASALPPPWSKALAGLDAVAPPVRSARLG